MQKQLQLTAISKILSIKLENKQTNKQTNKQPDAQVVDHR